MWQPVWESLPGPSGLCGENVWTGYEDIWNKQAFDENGEQEIGTTDPAVQAGSGRRRSGRWHRTIGSASQTASGTSLPGNCGETGGIGARKSASRRTREL